MSTARPTSASARPQGPGPRPDQGVQGATRPTPTQGRPDGAGTAGNPAAAARSRRVKLTVSTLEDQRSNSSWSFLISVALGIAGVVMVAVLWMILSGMGVFSEVNRLVGSVLQDSQNPFDLMDFLGFGRVLSLSIVIGVIDVILLTALSTLGAFLYNICSSLVGGLQLTLTDD